MDPALLAQAIPAVNSVASGTQEPAISLTAIITGVGWSAIFVALIYIGRKLQILDDLKRTSEKIKNNLKAVSDFLISSELPFNSTMLQNYSPTQLKEAGKKYLQDIGFVELFQKYSGDFYDSIDNEDPKTDYDIENAATRGVLQLFHEDYFAPIKDHFYNNPSDDKGAFVRVAGIYVRDQYMAWKSMDGK